MTIPEITAYVMALPVEDVRRLTATDIMGWRDSDCIGASCGYPTHYADDVLATRPPTQLIADWRPDIDRNQSRQVTDKVPKGPLADAMWLLEHTGSRWYDLAPLDESRAALIAHMIHAEGCEE